ncbi:MAG: hypothetical protein HOP23_09320 [Methylococcaceae bacterium]|nr:hypothetical protein [Methylococcaceae bacterium]
MNSKLIILLISVCAALLLIICGEWLYARLAQRELLASTNSTASKVSSDAMPSLDLTKHPEESYEQIVSRPLFIKGRKPVDEPKQEAAQTPVVPVVFDWILDGIYTRNAKLSALFSRSKTKVPKDNYRKVAVGGDLDGWKLTEIKSDRAILMSGANQKEVLLRKSKPKTPKPDNTQAVPAAQPVPTLETIPNPEAIPVPEPESPVDPFETTTDEQQL